MSQVLFDTIKTESTITDSVIVGFSTGKDSIVTMDLCFKYFKHVYPYFLYICPNLEFQERTLRWYEDKYNTEIIRLPHPDVAAFFRYGSFCPANPFLPLIGINDIYHYMRLETGAYWIAAGERIADSIWRRAMIKQSGSIDQKRGRFYPIAEWNKKEVLTYIKRKRLLLPLDSRKLGFSFKSFLPQELLMVKHTFPDDYEKIKHMYPFVGATVKRLETYGEI